MNQHQIARQAAEREAVRRANRAAGLLDQASRASGRHGQLAEIAELEIREAIPILRKVEEPTSYLQRRAVKYEPAPALDLAGDLSTLDDTRQRRGGLDEPHLPLSTLRVSDDTDCHSGTRYPAPDYRRQQAVPRG